MMPQLGKSRILVIEDNSDIGECLATILEEEGYQCALADNVDQGLSLICSMKKFQLVFLDWVLGNESGKAFFDRAETAKILLPPTLILTALPSYAVNETRAAGIVSKPIEIEILLKMLTGLLNHAA